MLDRRIKLRHLETVTAIARQGSLKGACAELNLTQPALSKTLKELEEILGAALVGIEDAMNPGPPLTGSAYGQDLPQLAADWVTAVDLFEADPLLPRIFEPRLIRNYVRTKRQEIAVMGDIDETHHWKTYLETV